MLRQKRHNTALILAVSAMLVVSANLSFAQSVRSRGMGSAFIGLANDESATVYNPAGLSQLQGREASIQAKVNETDVYKWGNVAFTGHIYQDPENNSFSITDYLEHNILEEPIPRRPKYSYGISYSQDNMGRAFGDLPGAAAFKGQKRETKEAQVGFATRFPIARRMLSREQLFGGIKFKYRETSLEKTLQKSTSNSFSMGAGLMYHYNDKITCGLTLEDMFEHTNSDEETDMSVNAGVAVEVAKGTTVALDGVNLSGNDKTIERQCRVGIEKVFVENDFTMRIGSLNGTLTMGFGMQMLPNVRVDYSYYDGDIVAEHYVGAQMSFD